MPRSYYRVSLGGKPSVRSISKEEFDRLYNSYLASGQGLYVLDTPDPKHPHDIIWVCGYFRDVLLVSHVEAHS